MTLGGEPMPQFNIDAVEEKTMAGLKDFQKTTVERIDYLFRHGQNRVLIADEVGMGKTLIARGAIVKTARIRQEVGDELFKVVYICSNISIANQNIQKLKVSSSARIEGVSDTRLSMLHLKIAEQESDSSLRDSYIQLIPLTPETSFRMTTGGGTVNERSLMFAILSRMKELSGLRKKLETFLIHGAESSWGYYSFLYENRVRQLEKSKDTDYPSTVIEEVRSSPVLPILIEHLKGREKGTSPYKDYAVLNKLRVMFAKISTGMLEPDLVIMDEFQRFKFLLDSDQESETGILAHRFLGGGDTRILLLSATPYKLYSTPDEIDAAQVDEHYAEFLQVTNFLFADSQLDFHQIWSDYSAALREARGSGAAILQIKKTAEDALYSGVCRTERISVMDAGDYTDDSSVKEALRVTNQDIASYLAMGKLLKVIEGAPTIPVDYVKSCPFLMSFMQKYKVKEAIEKHFLAKPDEVGKAKKDILWVKPSDVENYRPLPAANARLEKLKEVALEGGAELFLWVPPSRPYYPLQGAYRNSKNFSKVLVFSSWEMVPRMIGAMVSYEAERRTIGKVGAASNNINPGNRRYSARRRYPYPRLQFSMSALGEPQRMNLFCLLYPSAALADMYDPIASMNDRLSLSDIERSVRTQVQARLNALKGYQKSHFGPEDERWYYLAPMLMDGAGFVRGWLSALRGTIGEGGGELDAGVSSDRSNKGFPAHIARLEKYIEGIDTLNLGRMPDDLVSTLVDMTLGSPAVCIFRSFGGNVPFATYLSRVFFNYFNSTETTAVVELAADRHHAKKADDNTHWQDVLLYCKDGCFQAMFDEYLHIVRENLGFADEDKRDSLAYETICKGLRMHTASYKVDTYDLFRGRVQGKQTKKDSMRMRAHYAVGFVTDGDDEKRSIRKDSIRDAFNSPLRPFVLASTSIGQEGLDFHCYCRKVMHWNLPGNPTDLEQREGRVNRFKCLAIRQNVAEKYGDIHFSKDVWSEMFQAAQAEKHPGQSDLVPFWCFGEDQQVKIERIVPMYPMSRDEIAYERLIKILSLYRLTLGQARQEELLEYIFQECKEPNELKELFIDLSPFSKGIEVHTRA